MTDMSVADHQLGAGFEPSRLMTYAGGVVSLALIAGGVFWGVNLVLRDVNGIPVVPAARAEMRVAPSEPGGDVADNAGFAVNSVAAVGTAAPVADRVRLAPEDTGLTQEDLTPVVAAEASGIADDAPEVIAALSGVQGVGLGGEIAGPPGDASSDDVARMVDQIMIDNGLEPTPVSLQQPLAREHALATAEPALAPAEPRADVIPASVPGVSHAIRPQVRPAVMRPSVDFVAEALASSLAASTDTGVSVTAPGAIPAGTVLAQIGAFDSPELAVREWDRISSVYQSYFGTRSRVIQRAETGGRTFYRLRVSGFSDLADSRRFCSAIKSGGGSDCIPVVAR